jgi:hypothetical protein
VLGNFFIGIGPVILGCAALFALFYLLIPDSSQAWSNISAQVKELDRGLSMGSYLSVLQGSALIMVKLIFTASNLATWRFWVFLYLAICVASNIRLSWSDLKIALSGLGCVILPFLLINLIGLLTGSGADRFFPVTASSLGVVYSILILALFMVVIGFILIYILAAGYYKLKYRSVLNPF